MVPVLKLKFEAVDILMLGMLVLTDSWDIYNSFDTLFSCFYTLMNEWEQKIFQT